MPMVEAVLLWTSVPSDLLPCSVIQPTAVQPATSQKQTWKHIDHYQTTIRPLSDRRVLVCNSSYLCAYALMAAFINSWCQREKLWYALLMRANKPETAVQSSTLFIFYPLGITWYFLHMHIIIYMLFCPAHAFLRSSLFFLKVFLGLNVIHGWQFGIAKGVVDHNFGAQLCKLCIIILNGVWRYKPPSNGIRHRHNNVTDYVGLITQHFAAIIMSRSWPWTYSGERRHKRFIIMSRIVSEGRFWKINFQSTVSCFASISYSTTHYTHSQAHSIEFTPKMSTRCGPSNLPHRFLSYHFYFAHLSQLPNIKAIYGGGPDPNGKRSCFDHTMHAGKACVPENSCYPQLLTVDICTHEMIAVRRTNHDL